MDIMSKKERSERMSKIRSKWTKQEKIIHNHLKGNKVNHKMHPKIVGNPDILIKDNKLAVFLHGCFWHKCSKCYKEPRSNKKYWISKIENNVRRDIRNKRILRKDGFKTMTIWEHNVKKINIGSLINKIR